ncbi:MAG: glutamyl-tRNA reductase [Gemmatirosa sp.]
MLISLAVDYRYADVATRERFHLSEQRIAHLYERVPRDGREVLAVSTCNRTEVYAWTPTAAGPELGSAYARLAREWTTSAAHARALLAVAQRREGAAAVRHLLLVAAGVESQVLGDGQLLGQLRDAYRRAVEAGHAGSVLGRLFERALHVGKRVRGETALSSGRYSVGSEAASLALRRFGSLDRARVVVVGCGRTGTRVARQLAKLGARDLVLINRSPAAAETLAAQVGGRVAAIETLHVEVAMADVAIVVTGAETPILRADPLVVARRHCATTACPLLVIDLSLPRNVDHSVACVPGVVLADLDALLPALAAGERDRRSALPAAAAIVEVEARHFLEWMDEAAAREAIRPLREALGALCRREVAHGGGDAAAARRTADRIVAKLLALPMTELRGALARGEPVDTLTTSLARLFATTPASVSGARAATGG